MTTMTTKTTLTKASRAAARRREAVEHERAAVREALADGHSIRAVAAAVGLSPTRVHQIAHEVDAQA